VTGIGRKVRWNKEASVESFSAVSGSAVCGYVGAVGRRPVVDGRWRWRRKRVADYLAAGLRCTDGKNGFEAVMDTKQQGPTGRKSVVGRAADGPLEGKVRDSCRWQSEGGKAEEEVYYYCQERHQWAAL
jgi:hypothetical protein